MNTRPVSKHPLRDRVSLQRNARDQLPKCVFDYWVKKNGIELEYNKCVLPAKENAPFIYELNNVQYLIRHLKKVNAYKQFFLCKSVNSLLEKQIICCYFDELTSLLIISLQSSQMFCFNQTSSNPKLGLKKYLHLIWRTASMSEGCATMECIKCRYGQLLLKPLKTETKGELVTETGG